MVNIPPIRHLRSSPQRNVRRNKNQVVASSATEKKQHQINDRRGLRDRRQNAADKSLVMDRRLGGIRRRSSISLSV